ncbi:MAG: polysaccharide deacetylase, partial [Oscillospiraceae bacterium]|nr:polysaccharide deacetylase [Oscillospiraceae bacterium]
MRYFYRVRTSAFAPGFVRYCISKTIPFVDSLDWKELSAPDITKRVLGKVQSGSIVLFHNAAKHTPEALPGI